MATTMLAVHTHTTNTVTDAEQCARIVNFLRNMTGARLVEGRNVDVPVRTTSNPSPQKQTASNRHPGQTHTRTEIHGALNHELAMARFLMHDLADHVFGHIVSTELARDILQKFTDDKVVQIFEDSHNLLHPGSDDARRAIKEAFECADRYDCHRPGTQNDGEESGHSTKTKAVGKQKAKTYSFRWTTFPTEPLREDDLVKFLNNITDRAFAFAKPKLAVANPELRHRFAAPEDKHHAVPLSYEPDGEDMRPDFLLLPIEAFSDDFKTVDQKYVNFTASRLVGESKTKDLAAGVEQLERYARGLKRAQPWIYYVLGLTVTKDKAVFMRGEGSGVERVELMLTNGRGCIELIRILLGLALADKVDLGHNPAVVLEGKVQACKARNVAWSSNASTSKLRFGKNRMTSVPNPIAYLKTKSKLAVPHHSDSAVSHPRVIPSSSSKRDHSEIADDNDEETQPKKRKTDESVEDVDRFIFYPVVVYGHTCLGMLFTASSIRGRGTTVFCVVDIEDPNIRLALKASWQDLTRVAEQDAVMKHLKEKGSHPNLIVPTKTYKVEKDGEMYTTLGGIREFLEDQIKELNIENRVLTITASELKRPVKYFWGVHDFVRGLRGALLGHQYLTKIGILHRDISENNIVLALRPEDKEGGYLIDLDMAILQEADEPTPVIPDDLESAWDSSSERNSPMPSEQLCLPQGGNKKLVKAIRTGTFPYISYGVLRGRRHTQFDDVESFLYVLLLFFFSYAGPLSVSELCGADKAGFSLRIGSGRLSHMRNWPKEYADWADGSSRQIGEQKHSRISSDDGGKIVTQGPEFLVCLENNWPKELHRAISLLIEKSYKTFYRATTGSRTHVSHDAFIKTLDTWLDKYAHLEDKHSNCPFKEGMFRLSTLQR